MLVAITGECWISQPKLAHLIKKKGGQVSPKYNVTHSTDILVRGHSDFYKHIDFGEKEATASRLIQLGKSIVVVDDEEFRKLIEDGKPARVSDTVAGQPIEWFEPQSKQAFIAVTRLTGKLDREYTAKVRVEQGYLRKYLFGGKETSSCALCRRTFPTNLLIAAHIKPRSKCSLQEKQDATNIVFPLCLFGCDSLYERGYVSVNSRGKIEVKILSGVTPIVKRFLNSIKGKTCLSWNPQNAKYFKWHYEDHSRGLKTTL
jgi:hypothetical protein